MAIPDLLNLPNLTVLEAHETAGQYHVLVESAERATACDRCGNVTIHRHGSRKQTFIDLPHHGMPVTIHIDRARYRCQNPNCHAIRQHPLSDMAEVHQMTLRLVASIETKALETTFAAVAHETGLDEATIRRITADHIRRLEAAHGFETPRWMGLDEIHIIGKPRCVVANVEQNCMVNMLENRTKATVSAYLGGVPDRAKIEIVTMDMWKPYRDVARSLLPGAKIVVDKFHVVRMASAAMESVRKEIRKGLTRHRRLRLKGDRFVLLKRSRDLKPAQQEVLDEWCMEFPALGSAWIAKETFHQIWDCRTAQEARQCYEAWLADLDPAVAPAFSDLTRAMGNWDTEIFRYFENRATNAYTEALNSIIRVVNRAGRGYSFEVLRAKMLFAHGHQRSKTKVDRARPSFGYPSEPWMAGFMRPEDLAGTVEVGVPLKVIADMIERGEL